MTLICWLRRHHRDVAQVDAHGYRGAVCTRCRREVPATTKSDDDGWGDHLADLGPTVGHCSRCGEVRSSFYTCRDGGHTITKTEEREAGAAASSTSRSSEEAQ